MSFSIETFLFVTIILILFYLIKKARAVILLAASLVFIYHLDVGSFIWILAVTAIVYGIGIAEDKLIERIEKKKDKSAVTLKILVVASVVLCAVLLFALKNIARWGERDDALIKILLPIGFSYYIFQAISYIVDVYRRKAKAEKNPINFALYMCYFPKFVSGPIERSDTFLVQVNELSGVRLFENKRFSISFSTIIYGYFLKVVVADRLAFFTTRLLNDSARFGAAWLFLGMVMYSIQIYCDFAGYSAVAIGISNLFGIELTENFHAPYLSRNISEFWRKWHISLSRWLRDYIYIPLGGSRKGNARRFLNTAIVFIICGIWHGADASFLAWGLLHGFYVMAFGLYSEAKRKRVTGKEPASIMNVAGMVFTFLIVSFAWIFFGAPNIGSGACYVGRMLSMTPGVDSFAAQAADIGASRRDMILPIYGVVVLALDLLIARKDKRIGRAMQGIPDVARYAILYGMIMAILLLGIYGPGYNASSFMYVNF